MKRQTIYAIAVTVVLLLGLFVWRFVHYYNSQTNQVLQDSIEQFHSQLQPLQKKVKVRCKYYFHHVGGNDRGSDFFLYYILGNNSKTVNYYFTVPIQVDNFIGVTWGKVNPITTLDEDLGDLPELLVSEQESGLRSADFDSLEIVYLAVP